VWHGRLHEEKRPPHVDADLALHRHRIEVIKRDDLVRGRHRHQHVEPAQLGGNLIHRGQQFFVIPNIALEGEGPASERANGRGRRFRRVG
jgi:hypothetical protein